MHPLNELFDMWWIFLTFVVNIVFSSLEIIMPQFNNYYYFAFIIYKTLAKCYTLRIKNKFHR